MQNHGKKKNTEEKGDLDFLKTILTNRTDLDTLYTLVKIIPDDYFAWSELKKVLENDNSLLQLHYKINTESLITNVKSYPAWNYRLFLTSINVNLEKEDIFTKKVLFYDKRNFHCWNYRRKLNLPKIVDYFNYSCLHDLIFKKEISDFEDITYTNPYYEGCLYLFDQRDYKIFLKKYKNKTYLHFKEPFIGKIIVDDDLFIINLPVLSLILEKNDFTKICINDIKYLQKKEKINISYVNELLSLEENCVVLLNIKLKITKNMKERRELIDRLKIIDSLRKNYYESLLNSFYEIYELCE